MSDAPQSAFAVLTPPGRGGIAVIRCAGPAAPAALAACFRPARANTSSAAALPSRDHAHLAPGEYTGGGPPATSPAAPAAASLAYGHIIDADGRPLDEVILFRAAPGIFEVNCHGGPAAVVAICERLASLGLCQVDPDELLALEGAGPIELAARRLLRRAASPLAARIILDQLGGALAREIGEIVASLANPATPSRDREVAGAPAIADTRELTLAARTAAHPAPAHGADAVAKPDALSRLDALLDRWRTCGRFLADPPRIVIAGRPNAGKSTLLNRLAGADRAITSPAPGTTRDYVEAAATIEGLPVVLVDTAGLRDTEGKAGTGSGQRATGAVKGDVIGAVEQAGIDRARAEAARAAVVVYLVDACDGLTPQDAAAVASLGDRAIVAWNKIDECAVRLGGEGRPAEAPDHSISALTGEGAAALAAAVLARLGWRAADPGAAVPLTPEQAAALRQARDLVAAGRTVEARRILEAVV